jgi:CubicO group peptidase (beta-lactamase class C family)
MILIKSLLILFWLSFSVSGVYARIITDTLNSPSLSDHLLDEPSTPRILVYIPPGYDDNLQIKICDGGHVTGVRKHIEYDVFEFFDNHFKRNSLNIYLTGIQQARAYADSLRHRLNLPGFSIAVAKNNDIIWSDGLGYADIDRQIPVDPATTSFRIGSVSKLITAGAALLLHQQGNLELNAPIKEYLPDFPEQVSQVTARQLAGHLAGIRHYERDEYINRTHYRNIDETLSIFLNDTLRHKPGAAYAYSSYGYNLLGAVIQAAAGEEFREYVRQNLFEPLGMKSTFAEYPEMPELNRTQLYSSDQSGSFQHMVKLEPEGEDMNSLLSKFHQDRIDSVMHPLLEFFPGVSIAIGRDSTLFRASAYGYSEMNERKATTDTKFRVYSISKLWTSTAAAMLADAGKLDLNTVVQTYVPEFPDKEYSVTPLHLAYHSSGIRHYKDDEEVYSKQHCATVEEALYIFKEDPLLFEPGSRQMYSSWGYVLLSAVVEGAAGRSFLNVMNEMFEKAGMLETRHYPDHSDSGIAHAYEQGEDGKYKDVTWTNPSCKWGAGGFVSTASDVVRFNTALLGGRLVSPQFVQMLMEPDENGRHYFGGMSAGGRSMVRTDTRKGLVIAVLGNARASDVDLRQVTDAVAEIMDSN